MLSRCRIMCYTEFQQSGAAGKMIMPDPDSEDSGRLVQDYIWSIREGSLCGTE